MAIQKIKKPVGRPLFEMTDDVLEKVESLAARGLTQEQIAGCLNIAVCTLYDKKNNYPEFSEAIKRGQNKGISIIANALFDGAKSGDKVSQIFYLKCRANWKETSAIEHTIKPHETWLDELE